MFREKIKKLIGMMSKKSKVPDDFQPEKVALSWFWAPLASVFWTGYFPVASGTVGSFATYLILVIVYFRDPNFSFSLWYLVATLALIPIGAIICQKGDEMWGHDHSRIVFDEFVGMLVTFIFVPINLFVLFGGFLIFRFFDIFKLFPAKQIDEGLPGGWGVLLDDVMAGIYANLALQIIVRLVTLWRV